MDKATNFVIKLLVDNKLDSSYSVEFLASDRIEATDAIKLGAIGIDVPEENIYYDDDNIADDDAFDGEWMPDVFSACIPASTGTCKRGVPLHVAVAPQFSHPAASSLT